MTELITTPLPEGIAGYHCSVCDCDQVRQVMSEVTSNFVDKDGVPMGGYAHFGIKFFCPNENKVIGESKVTPILKCVCGFKCLNQDLLNYHQAGCQEAKRCSGK